MSALKQLLLPVSTRKRIETVVKLFPQRFRQFIFVLPFWFEHVHNFIFAPAFNLADKIIVEEKCTAQCDKFQITAFYGPESFICRKYRADSYQRHASINPFMEQFDAFSSRILAITCF